MSVHPEASASSKPQLSPKAAEIGGLSAMRQTMSEFSLDSLSSLLDEELSLEGAPAPQPAALVSSPALGQGLPTSTDGLGGLASPARQGTPVPFALTAGPAAPTELVSVTAARLASLTQPPSEVRKSSLEETQLYKSTPQPTIDLSVVRRSASEPTQAFSGHLADYVDVSATIPAVVDPAKSSVPETTFWSDADREAADLVTVTQPVALSNADLAEVQGVPEEASFTQPILDVEPAPAPTIAPQLATFFANPGRTTDAKWEQAVESDRQFTTMLLSDMDELPWKAPTPTPVVGDSAVASLEIVEAVEIVNAASAPLPASPVPAESPELDPAAFDVLEVVGAEQASVASSLSSQILPATQEAIPVADPKPKFAEPTQELRELAAFLLDRFTPGVSTAVALVGCEATRPGAQAAMALAAAVADATGVSTLIVDGDFAERDISSMVDFPSAFGFAEALGEPSKGRSYAQAISRQNLNLLPAGNAMPDASEAPARVAAWIAKAKQEYGLILVWLGVGEGDFARRLCGAADATLLLAAVDHDRPSRIEAASERVRSSNARTLGVALVR